MCIYVIYVYNVYKYNGVLCQAQAVVVKQEPADEPAAEPSTILGADTEANMELDAWLGSMAVSVPDAAASAPSKRRKKDMQVLVCCICKRKSEDKCFKLKVVDARLCFMVGQVSPAGNGFFLQSLQKSCFHFVLRLWS